VVALANSDLVDALALLRALQRELQGIVTSSGSGDWFVVTLVTGDRYDVASRLDRDAMTYRVNLGLDRRTYEQLFGPAPRQAAGYEVIDTGVDRTGVDVVMPPPVYAPMHWVCVVNPAEGSRAKLEDLLERAHALAKRQYDRRDRSQ
jgi:hypothetical protein